MRYGRRENEETLNEEKIRYLNILKAEDFKLWSESQLKAKIRNISKPFRMVV